MLLLPWWNKDGVAAGKIRDGLVKNFQRVNVLDWWNTTSNKLRPPSYVFREKIKYPMKFL